MGAYLLYSSAGTSPTHLSRNSFRTLDADRICALSERGHPHCFELVARGARLLLLKSEEPQKQVAPAIPKFPSACYLGVETDDLDAFHSKIVALGPRCIQPPLKQKNRDRIAIYTDPDRLALQITELEKFSI